MKFRNLIRVLSSVGGGPHSRLSEVLRQEGWDSRVESLFSPEMYRRLFHCGRLGRMAARLAAFGVFPWESFFRAIWTSSMESRGCPQNKPILVVTTNPFFLPHVLAATRWVHRCGVVALMYDIYPDALEAVGGVKPFVSRIMALANRWMIRHVDGVVYIGEVLRANAEARYGVNPKTWVIPTGGNIAEFTNYHHSFDEEFESWLKDRIIFSYVGNMGRMHDVGTFAEGIPFFLSQLSGDERKKVGFVFAASGPGIAHLQEVWGDKYADCLRILPPLPDEQWADLLMRSAVSLSSLTSEAYATSIPSKVQSAIAAKSVQVAVAPRTSDLAHLIETGHLEATLEPTPCGIVVDPGDVEGFAAALRRLSRPEEVTAFSAGVEQTAKRLDIPALSQKWQACFEAISAETPEPWSVWSYRFLKRSFDVAGACFGIVALSPILAATAVGVWIFLGRPVLFRQERPGLEGKPFELFKFRSMKVSSGPIEASQDGERLVPFGQRIRALSLDELPTLFNVLKGDMSFVGPRPLLMSYLPRYNARQKRRHWVRPGITGLAQVNGRNALSWEEKFDYDVWYAEHASILLDFKILWKTIGVVLKRSGISHAESATMPEFMGNRQDGEICSKSE